MDDIIVLVLIYSNNIERCGFMYTYKPLGVCSKEINFDVEDNKIKNVTFTKGCKGNLQGISKLIEGMDANEALKKATGTYGRIDEAVKIIDPRHE